jgi:hypothetical protein
MGIKLADHVWINKLLVLKTGKSIYVFSMKMEVVIANSNVAAIVQVNASSTTYEVWIRLVLTIPMVRKMRYFIKDNLPTFLR